MQKVKFSLKHYLDMDIAPTAVFRDNLLELENLCKQGLRENFLVELELPTNENILQPKNPYELSVIIAKDMVKKYNSENIIYYSK